jgi:SAM-dependent methyltransferase
MTAENGGSNPWLQVSPSDYEGHMRGIGQLDALNQIFREVYREVRPSSLAVLGCTTGNGLEHVDPEVTKACTGVDIHPEYLRIARQRFPNPGYALDLVCADLTLIELPLSHYQLVHAALLLEYVEPRDLLGRISRWLAPGGRCTIVLQLPAEGKAMITPSPYPSLGSLSGIMRLRDPQEVRRIAKDFGLEEVRSWEVPLPGAKRFQVLVFARLAE